MPGIDWRRYNWLNGVLLPVAAVSIRVAWLYPFIRLLLRNPFVYPGHIAYPLWLIYGLLMGAWIISGITDDPRKKALLTAGGGIIAVLLTIIVLFGMDVARPNVWFMRLVDSLTDFERGIPAPFVTFAITSVLWQRGLLARWASHDDLWMGFITGIIMLSLLLLLRERAIIDTVGFGLAGPVLTFALSGLMALALGGLARALATDSAAEIQRPALSRYWLMAVGSVVLFILALGWGLGQSFAPESIGGILRLLRPVGRVILQGLLYILFAIAYLTFWLLNPLIEFLRQRIRDILDEPPLETDPRQVGDFLEEQARHLQLSPQVIDTLQVALVVLLIASLVLAFLVVRGRRRRRPPRLMTEERDFIWSAELMGQQIRDLFRRRRPRRLAPYIALTPSEDSRQAVRRVYQQLLARASDASLPRPPAVTPLAFQAQLEELVPDEAAALDTLTRAYLWARYTDEPPPAGIVESARAAWERIREAWPPDPEPEEDEITPNEFD